MFAKNASLGWFSISDLFIWNLIVRKNAKKCNYYWLILIFKISIFRNNKFDFFHKISIKYFLFSRVISIEKNFWPLFQISDTAKITKKIQSKLIFPRFKLFLRNYGPEYFHQVFFLKFFGKGVFFLKTSCSVVYVGSLIFLLCSEGV